MNKNRISFALLGITLALVAINLFKLMPKTVAVPNIDELLKVYVDIVKQDVNLSLTPEHQILIKSDNKSEPESIEIILSHTGFFFPEDSVSFFLDGKYKEKYKIKSEKLPNNNIRFLLTFAGSEAEATHNFKASVLFNRILPANLTPYKEKLFKMLETDDSFFSKENKLSSNEIEIKIVSGKKPQDKKSNKIVQEEN